MKLGGSATAAAKKKSEPKKAPAGLSIFAESMKEEENKEEERIRQGFHPRVQITSGTSRQLEEQMGSIMKEDPTAFQYDELTVADEDAALAKKKNQVQTEGLEQKKRVGLFIPTGGPQQGQKSQYISKLEKVKEFRDMEKEIVEQRVINRDRKKEKNLYGDKDVFVTSAYKERLKERDSFLREQALKDHQDEVRDAGKMENGMGFAAFHRTLLDSACDAKPVPSASSGASASASHTAKKEVKKEQGDGEDERREEHGAMKKSASSTSLPGPADEASKDDERENCAATATGTGDVIKHEAGDVVKEEKNEERGRIRERALIEEALKDEEQQEEQLQENKRARRSEVEERAVEVERRAKAQEQSKGEREGKAQSAKERFLARKRMQQQQQQQQQQQLG